MVGAVDVSTCVHEQLEGGMGGRYCARLILFDGMSQ